MKRDREKRSARGAAQLPALPRILVLCEGKVTEPTYLRAFRSLCRNPRVEVEIGKERGVPLTLVEEAVKARDAALRRARREKDDNLSFDEVWCVFDVDDHPHLPEARALAGQKEIRLAISNPCFELWLLLHFRPSPGAQHRKDVASQLSRYLSDYDKTPQMREVLPGYTEALKRARRLEAEAAVMGELGRNPSTTVHHLTESIRGDRPLLP